jgi:hypothetical protein
MIAFRDICPEIYESELTPLTAKLFLKATRTSLIYDFKRRFIPVTITELSEKNSTQIILQIQYTTTN